MSFSLDGAVSNSRVEYVSGITGTGYPMTIACWCYCTNGIFGSSSTPTYMNLISVSNSTKATSHSIMFGAANINANTRVRAASSVNSGTPATATPATGRLANTWVHVVGVFRSNSVTPHRSCYVNGGTKTNNSTARSTTNLVDFVAGATGGLLTREFEGYLAEVGIWNKTLTDDDALALSRGAKPTMVQPEYLVHYVPFIQNTNDIVFGQGPKLVQGATASSPHPLRYG